MAIDKKIAKECVSFVFEKKEKKQQINDEGVSLNTVDWPRFCHKLFYEFVNLSYISEIMTIINFSSPYRQ